MPDQFHDITILHPEEDFLDDWLVRTCELIDKYQPKILYFDWWIQNLAFKPYLRKLAAYYYNRAVEWGIEVAIDYRYDAFLWVLLFWILSVVRQTRFARIPGEDRHILEEIGK
ncbi:MAG: alpha-L-fucosidase [Oliverpabstia sp.]|nr:alpha-L-fucosidase [Oliverpabstia sp.]